MKRLYKTFMLISILAVLSAGIFASACETADFVKYDVVFYVDKEVYDTVTVDSPDFDFASAMPETPVKYDDNGVYEFLGWYYEDGTALSDRMPDKAVRLYAKFEYTLYYYTVEFLDWNGSYIPVDGKPSQTVVKGGSAVAPEEPVREGYTFVGWDRAFDNIQKRTTVNAMYAINKHTLTFVADGETLFSGEAEYGAVVSAYAPSLGDKDGYEFVGWQSEDASFDGTMPDKDVTFTAVWKVKAPVITLTSTAPDAILYGQTASYELSFAKNDAMTYEIAWYVDDVLAAKGGASEFTTDKLNAGIHEVYAILTVFEEGYGSAEVQSMTMTLVVDKLSLTVTLADKDIVYGDVAPETYDYEITGFADGEDESVLSGELVFDTQYKQGSAVGDYTVNASGYVSSDYEINYYPAYLKVAKRQLVVKPDDTAAVYGESVSRYTYRIDNLASCDSEGELGTVLFSSAYKQGDGAGTYEIKASKGFDGSIISNYLITYETAVLTVGKKEVKASLANLEFDVVFGEDVPVFALVYDTLVGDDTLEDLGTYDIVTDYSKYSKVGTYTASIVFDGTSANYDVKAGAPVEFDVKAAPLAVKVSEVSKNGQGRYWTLEEWSSYAQGLPEGFVMTGSVSLNTDEVGDYVYGADEGYFVWNAPLAVEYEGEDYTDCFDISCDIRVTLNDSVSLKETGYDGDYDGKEHGAYVEVTQMPEGAVLEYLDGETWTSTAPVFVNAGEYEVQYRIVNNDILIKHGTLSVVIRKIANVISVEQSSVGEYTYNGVEQVIDGFEVTAFENPDIYYADNTFTDVPDGGTLAVRVITGETANYLATETVQVVRINKANYTKAPDTVYEVYVAHDKTLSDYEAPAYYRWLDEGDNLATVLRAGANTVDVIYNGNPQNFNDLVTTLTVTGLKSVVTIVASDSEVNINQAWTSEAYVAREGITLAGNAYYTPVLVHNTPDVSYGTTYAVTYTLEENDFYTADAKTVYVKVKSVSYNNVLYTVEDALNAASGGTIVVTADTAFADPAYGVYRGAGYYTLKADTTLLVPFDSTHSTDRNKVTNAVVATNLSKAYVTLTVPHNVTIKCESGSRLFVLAIRNSTSASGNTGSVNGSNYGALKLEEGARIDIYGGTFESSGYTYGEGAVYVYSGEVSEPMIMSGYKGGNITYATYKVVFPVNQYMFANIATDLYVYSGVKYFAKACVWVENKSVNTDIGYISSESSSFIQLTSGRIIKSYDETTGVTKFSFEGNANINDMYLKLAINIVIEYDLDVNTSGKQVPFNGFFDFDIHEGSVVNSSVGIKILPGCNVTVEKGAVLNVNDGGNVFVYSGDSKIVYDKSDRYKDTPLVDGWQDGGNNMSYPLNASNVLVGNPQPDFNASTAGVLAVAGTLNVNSGAKIAGVVTALEGGKIVISSGATVKGVKIKEDYSNSNDKILFVKAHYFYATNSLLGKVNGVPESQLVADSTYVGTADGNWVKQ